MSASYRTSRRAATEEFLREGLGGKLSQNATRLIQATEKGDLGSNQRVASNLACGNIIERILWMGLGRWLGYLHNEEPLTSEERAFLIESAPLIDESQWPDLFVHLMSLLANPRTDTGIRFFAEQIVGVELGRGAKKLCPIFQAAHVIAESLTEGPITAFFIFLREDNTEEFNSQTLSPDKVFGFLEENGDSDDVLPGHASAEAIVAGFIRYTEFLSAMDDLFPSAEAYQRKGTSIPDRVAARELLAIEIIAIIQWRFPIGDTALERYKAVTSAFLKMVSDQFDRCPELGLRWSEMETSTELLRLSSRFFSVEDRNEETTAILRERNNKFINAKTKDKEGSILISELRAKYKADRREDVAASAEDILP
jgi:hypothetical protein